MAFIGNLIWICAGGWMTAIGWLFAGIICYVTILGIPLGHQCMKMAKPALCPFVAQVY
ncbi:YccF domain-containing protein [Paratractidigestivibacter sp.]|uniref:YccF domain-containing protein n=1 Tax=Paratractidigestivibacter sp. TaxID=2847316 RepID=UPI002ABDA28C|nr:YccF domain-containing protein [Paratractidigestivibacter sp.]